MKLLLGWCGRVCVNLAVVMRGRPSCVNVVVPMPRDGGGHDDVTMIAAATSESALPREFGGGNAAAT